MSHDLPRTSLLKIPRQERSVQMVHLILDAAVIVLSQQGMLGFTTNRVASVAGVSIGSLYQYFANKESLVAGVVERGVLSTESQIRAMVSDGGDPVVLLRRSLNGVIAALRPHARLIRELLGTMPMLSRGGIISILEPRLMDITRDVILYAPGHQLQGGPAALYVGVGTTAFATLKWLAEQPPAISQDDLVDALISQLMTHIVAVG